MLSQVHLYNQLRKKGQCLHIHSFFKVLIPGLHMMKNFAIMHSLNLFVTFKYGLTQAIIY